MNWKNNNYHFEGLEKHLKRIKDKKARLDSLRPLPVAAIAKLKEALAIEWTHHSNSIEGNTLTLRETKMVLEDGLTVKGKSLKEHFEVLNHHEAIAYIENTLLASSELKAEDLLHIHYLVMQKIEKTFAGRYRNAGVGISGANFVSPNALAVNELMDELLLWVNDEGNSLDITIKASLFHHRLVWIHPFFDGNGRTARLLLNLLLMKAGYPPAIILKNDKKKYYDALNKANQGDCSKLLLLVLQALERTLDICLSNLSNTYEDYQPISDIVNEPGVPYGQEYLSLLARRGKIDAFKEGRNWLTTKEAVLHYIHSKIND